MPSVAALGSDDSACNNVELSGGRLSAAAAHPAAQSFESAAHPAGAH